MKNIPMKEKEPIAAIMKKDIIEDPKNMNEAKGGKDKKDKRKKRNMWV